MHVLDRKEWDGYSDHVSTTYAGRLRSDPCFLVAASHRQARISRQTHAVYGQSQARVADVRGFARKRESDHDSSRKQLNLASECFAVCGNVSRSEHAAQQRLC